jgi:hypothetical protein
MPQLFITNLSGQPEQIWVPQDIINDLQRLSTWEGKKRRRLARLIHVLFHV